MCGRYSLHSEPEALARQFGLDAIPEFAPRYNIAPMSDVLVVKRDGVAMVHWGFRKNIPNLRAETAAGRKRRCLVPASGFYEWQQERGHKQPYYVQPVGEEAGEELFALAGVWHD